MALIGNIRKNRWLVMFIIGGAIILFIITGMDAEGAGGPVGPAENAMARIGDIEVDRNDFERTLGGVFRGGDSYQNRDNLFNFYVNEGLIRNEAAALGLAVSEEEEQEMYFGATPAQSIQSLFRNPQTGQIDRATLSKVQGYIESGTLEKAVQDPANQLSPDLPTMWKYTTRQATANRLQEKMIGMVSKGMYAPSWQAQDFANQQVRGRKVAVVKVPFDKIEDDAVSVSDDDLKSFIDENESLFDNPEESRVLSYVAFEVKATEEDKAAIRAGLEEIMTDWERETTAQGDSLFAVGFGDRGSYSPNYVKAEAVAEDIRNVVMEEMNVGEIYGPYEEGDAMKVVKLLDRREMADSANIRQIVRRGVVADARQLIDSLKTVLERSPGKWSDLAEEFSQDAFSSGDGGVLRGVKPGQQVRPVDKVIFRTGTVGELTVVESPGTVTLLQVQSRSRSTSTRVKLAYVTDAIAPRPETEDAVLAEAQSFLNGKSTFAEVRSAAEAAGMEVKTTGPLAQSNYALTDLGSGQEVRDIMCWAFGADEGDVSGVVYTFTDPQLFFENNYVIVGLDRIVPEGIAPVAAIKEVLTPTVRNRKKGEAIASAIGSKDLTAIAAEYEVEVDTVTSNLSLASLPGDIGREPKVIAAAAAVATGTRSEPIVGNDGVYVLVATNDAPTTNSTNLPGARQQLNITTRQQMIQFLLPALRSTADIEDQRPKLECQ